MHEGLRKLIFDTSGINALAKDSECLTVLAGLRSAYLVGVTETTISEIAADPDEERRVRLLGIVERLLKFGMCVNPFHVIIEDQAKAYLADRSGYEWRRVNVRFPEAKGEVVRQEIIHEVSEQTRLTLKQWDKDFRAIFSNARPAFQKLFEGRDGARPGFKEVTDRLLGEGGAHREIAVDLFERGTGTRLTQEEIHDFTERSLPFKALLVALCFSQYDRCIRDERQESLGRAGRLDMFSATYLPYCKLFVTNDEGQCKALKTVAEAIGIEIYNLLYPDFKERLFGIGGGARQFATSLYAVADGYPSLKPLVGKGTMSNGRSKAPRHRITCVASNKRYSLPARKVVLAGSVVGRKLHEDAGTILRRSLTRLPAIFPVVPLQVRAIMPSCTISSSRSMGRPWRRDRLTSLLPTGAGTRRT